MDFKKIDNKYRPIPFWSWNEKLDTEETRRQVRLMKEAGIGGYFMHARGGLLTDYMGEEWFENVDAATDEGEKLGMRSFAYDENGWPSGFADGMVLALGEDYQLKMIVYKPTADYNGDPEKVLLERDGYTYYIEVNDLYVDLLNPAVTDAFIKCTHEKYRENCGNRIEGFFTDEPQLARYKGFPYSVITKDEFKSRYGYDLIENLPSLFFDDEKSDRVRFDFWYMVTDLFSKNFFKRIYDWCEQYGYKLTGHLVSEEVFDSIIPTNGSAMPHYEYMHIPGIDWLGRPIPTWGLAHALSSVAAQLGKKQVLTESYALTGHNVSHGELKRILEWQMVRGINLLCTHLEGYSNRGIRKRDYPAAIYYQQPWWDDAKIFFDTVSRIGMIIGDGKKTPDTLLINPISTAWCMYNGYVESYDRIKEIRKIDVAYTDLIRTLENKHIIFHIGDEIIMERHARVEAGELVIGEMRYKRIVLPECHKMLLDNTKRLLDEFVKAGGVITTVDEIEANPILPENDLTYTKRTFDDCTVHYFVNSAAEGMTVKIDLDAVILDPTTGDTKPYSGSYTFEPYESLILVENRAATVASTPIPERNIPLSGEWEVVGASDNSLTLDRCDYYFDGELIERAGYVLNILPRINEKRKPVALHQLYRFTVEDMPEGEIYLVTETPDIFDIKVNGKPLEKRDAGYLRDISFRKLPITELVVEGENTVEFDSVITQSKKTFDHLDRSWAFETMANSLSYDIEIEPIYVAGNFAVKINAPVTELALDAYRVKELAPEGGASFVITRAVSTVDAEHLDASGYPQFAGTITLKKTVTLDSTDYSIRPVGRGMNSIHVKVNGKEVGTKMFAPYDISIKDALVIGENEIEITIVNNLRNMQGPTHLKLGESHFASRHIFYQESNVLCHGNGAKESCHDELSFWDGDVCLVHFGTLTSGAPTTDDHQHW